MLIFFIIGLLLGAVAVVFALQNITPITVTFLSWHLNGSLALILFLVAIAGAFAVLLIVLPESIGNYFKFKRLLKENKELTEELRKQKELTVFAKNTPATPEEIKKIEDGAIGSDQTKNDQ